MSRGRAIEPPHTCRSRYCAGAVVCSPWLLVVGDLLDVWGEWEEVTSFAQEPVSGTVRVATPLRTLTIPPGDRVTVLMRDKHIDARSVAS